MSDFNTRCVAWALTKLGRPYIWGASGDVLWTAQGMVPTSSSAQTVEGYDCAGLVKCASLACGGTDLRAVWSARDMFKNLPAPLPGEGLTLRFYGLPVTHVAFDLGNNLILEAAGGDHTTTTLQKSFQRTRAMVRVGFESRSSEVVGYRSLASMETAKP